MNDSRLRKARIDSLWRYFLQFFGEKKKVAACFEEPVAEI